MVSYSTDPLATDPYSRLMVESYDDREMISVSTGFQAWFGRPETGSKTVYSPDSNVVEIDIVRGNKRVSTLGPRGMISRSLGDNYKSLNVNRYSTFSRKYPLSEEFFDLSADQLEFRVAGENPYSAQSRLTRMRTLAMSGNMEMIRRKARLFEVLSAQSILTGKMPGEYGASGLTTDTDKIYDFKRNAAHTVTVAIKWDNASADIPGDLVSMCNKIRRNGKVTPDFLGVGQGALQALTEQTNMKQYSDVLRYDLFSLNPEMSVPSKYQRFIDAGWQVQGKLYLFGYVLYVFSYMDDYEDHTGTAQFYLPTDQALLASTSARCDRYFGPPERLPMIPQREELYRQLFGVSPRVMPNPPNIKNAGAVLNPGMFYFDAYPDNQWKTVTLRAQSAPIYATTSTDAFGLLKGLV
jgi:hypothetical protein